MGWYGYRHMHARAHNTTYLIGSAPATVALPSSYTHVDKHVFNCG